MPGKVFLIPLVIGDVNSNFEGRKKSKIKNKTKKIIQSEII